MFAVSYKWIVEILKEDVSFSTILKILNLQGFEVKSVDDLENGDHIITIEVKANRPDMLSHFGVSREIASFLGIKLSEPICNMNFQNIKSDDIKIELDESLCDCYYSVSINNIDNSVETPEYIKDRLAIFGIEPINIVVDISNYLILEYGQPTHIYDRSKISGNCLKICSNNKSEKFSTLSKKEISIEPNDIVIKDSEKTLCIAGIIGSSDDAVETDTKNIIIESASFSKVPIRITSKRTKVSTLASFRFERGVDPDNSFTIISILSKKIIELCGGTIVDFFEYKSNKSENKKINLRTDRVNKILGISLCSNEIAKCLEKYSFKCDITEEKNISVSIPSFRLDIEREIDLIEEVARSYGYDNINPVNLCTELVYRPNHLHDNIDKIKNSLIGFGFSEVINYSFIPESIYDLCGIDKSSCVILQNPLSNLYNLMRPNMVFSMLSSLVYNYSIGNSDISLFEVGKVYFKDNNSENLSIETNSLGLIFSGAKIGSGFGIIKSIKYDFYDLVSYLKALFDSFNQKFDFELKSINYLENSYNIVSSGECIGQIGTILKNKFVKVLPNVKLIKDDIFYCEINLEKIKFSKKILRFESDFPSIIRQYNLMCPKELSFKEVFQYVKEFDKAVNEVLIKDVYEDSKMKCNEHSVLLEIKYRLESRTLSSEEIEKLERSLLDSLLSRYKCSIKK